jgi:hypothetical protein
MTETGNKTYCKSGVIRSIMLEDIVTTMLAQMVRPVPRIRECPIQISAGKKYVILWFSSSLPGQSENKTTLKQTMTTSFHILFHSFSIIIWSLYVTWSLIKPPINNDAQYDPSHVLYLTQYRNTGQTLTPWLRQCRNFVSACVLAFCR